MASRGTRTSVLRGPIIIFGAIVSLLWPYISTWSLHFILQLVAILTGVVFLLVDTLTLVKTNIRSKIQRWYNSFVLDDLLRLLYNPETGIIPCFIASFVGAYSMYGLHMDDKQKTTLVQASLWSTEEEARQILLEPGGTQLLLPTSLRDWLSDSNDDRHECFVEPTPSFTKQIRQQDVTKVQSPIVETVEDIDSNSSASDDYRNISLETSDARISPQVHSENGKNTSRIRTDRNHIQEVSFLKQSQLASVPPSGIPSDPMLEMIRICKNMALERLKPLMADVPEQKLEKIGTVAVVTLVIQLLWRVRSKRSILAWMTGLGLSSTAFGAFSMVVVRQAILGSIQDIDSLKLVSSGVAIRSLQRLKQLISNDKRWKTTLAFLILALVGKHRSQPTGPLPLPNVATRCRDERV